MDISASAVRSESKVASIAIAFLLAITLAEIVTAFVDTVAGMVLHVAVLLAVLSFCGRMTSRESQMFFLPLLLLPLIRIVSLGLPLHEF